MGIRAETILLPIELLKQLKPSEFNDLSEYHIWQKPQLTVLEASHLLHPSIPIEKSSPQATKLREIIRASESAPIDTGKTSDTMMVLCKLLKDLGWNNGTNTTPNGICHYVDGYPLDIHLYLSLLQSCFDLKDETVMIDEVDELMDLMKKTWTSLGINRGIHNVCFAWVLFEHFILTGQVEQGLLGAVLVMLAEVSNDAKRASGEWLYGKILGSTMAGMQNWAERWLVDYHERFRKGGIGLMESVLPLAPSVAQILHGNNSHDSEKLDMVRSKIDYYI